MAARHAKESATSFMDKARMRTDLLVQDLRADVQKRYPLLPTLVAKNEVLPWAEQSRNEPAPVHGRRNGDAFRACLDEQPRHHTLTAHDLPA